MMTESKNLTPLMKQYWDIKTLHPDKILLFRMGDFFEMFHDDAIQAAPILGIALTQRNKKSQDDTPMCGVPHHSISGPINKLLSRGFKVAICDQLEDAALAKGLVKRGVTRILTPGMVYDPDTLPAERSHFMMSLDSKSISFADVTTGECFCFEYESIKELTALFQVMDVAEVILDQEGSELHEQVKTSMTGRTISFHPSDEFSMAEDCSKLPTSAKRILSYVHSLNSAFDGSTLRPFEKRSLHQKLNISSTSLRHLEIFQNYRGDEKGSLFEVMNKTQTSPGSRKLRQWMMFPLSNLESIRSRQDQVQFFRDRPSHLKKIRQVLFGLGDLERRFAKISSTQNNARDLKSLAQACDQALQVLQWCKDHSCPIPAGHLSMDLLAKSTQDVLSALHEDLPLTIKQGGLIQKTYSKELEEIVDLATNSQSLVEQLEAREKASTGISSLKIRYNNVFGYYIEITHTHKEKVPASYKRKQTLANAERFYTEELMELERKVLSAQSRRSDLEFEIFEGLRLKMLSLATPILSLSDFVSEVDVISSMAWLSLENKYTRPLFCDEQKISLKASRHPVVEQFVGKDYVANDILLQNAEALLITGPNMAGKSTVLRQVALTSLMAQMGSYVPATEAEISLVDSIYTRIGASDHLTEGLSTFMVEMTETAEMLNKATSKSLIILDEVGRGTSTYDGLSLAQSILEFIVQKLKSFTLFATHYHELTKLEKQGWPIRNAHMSVSEKNGEIRFLHDLKKGPATKSYGLQVAQLAGVPAEVIRKAETILKQLESGTSLSAKNSVQGQLDLFATSLAADTQQAQELQTELESVKGLVSDLKSEMQKLKKTSEEIQKLNLNQMTPLQALQFISEVQNKLQ